MPSNQLTASGAVARLHKFDPITGNVITLEYVEVVDDPCSPRGHMENDHSEVARVILVDWEFVQVAARLFLGYPVRKTNAPVGGGIKPAPGFNWIARCPPEYHPDWLEPTTNAPFLYATDFEFEPWGVPEDGDQWNRLEDTAVYNLAKCTITYNTRSYDVYPGDVKIAGEDVVDESALTRFVTFNPNPSGEYLSVKQGVFKFVDYPAAARPVPGAPGKIEPADRLQIVWHEVPQLCVGLPTLNPGLLKDYPIDRIMGRVNSTEFAGAAPGTLLCEAPAITRYRAATGARVCDVQYNFRYLPRGSTIPNGLGGTVSNVGHNVILDADTAPWVYREVTIDGAPAAYPAAAGKHIYDDAEFRDLFRPPDLA